MKNKLLILLCLSGLTLFSSACKKDSDSPSDNTNNTTVAADEYTTADGDGYSKVKVKWDANPTGGTPVAYGHAQYDATGATPHTTIRKASTTGDEDYYLDIVINGELKPGIYQLADNGASMNFHSSLKTYAYNGVGGNGKVTITKVGAVGGKIEFNLSGTLHGPDNIYEIITLSSQSLTATRDADAK
jgi:hypothetical protein